eukprot:3752590-Alexandrium_andersonii.AAC.1
MSALRKAARGALRGLHGRCWACVRHTAAQPDNLEQRVRRFECCNLIGRRYCSFAKCCAVQARLSVGECA